MGTTHLQAGAVDSGPVFREQCGHLQVTHTVSELQTIMSRLVVLTRVRPTQLHCLPEQPPCFISQSDAIL